MLTSNGTDLGEEDYTKVVDNFDRFLESINTPLSNEWFRSNGLCDTTPSEMRGPSSRIRIG
jgi:hypothetical protein